MHVLTGRNVNDIYPMAVRHLAATHLPVDTRDGPALVAPSPVTTHYSHPMERVLWDAARDANPFFHLLESLWMLDGCFNTDLILYLVPRMRNYTENPDTEPYFHGAYGFRWRSAFGVDQLAEIIGILRENPTNRRIMLQMWEATRDLNHAKKDIPCNTMVKFMTDPSGTRLNMVVFCRSNDLFMGCYGANVVQFSILQEYLATMSGMTVGWYEQVSCDWHAYTRDMDKYAPVALLPRAWSYDQATNVRVTPIVTHRATFDQELREVMGALSHAPYTLAQHEVQHHQNRIFFEVVRPMMNAYRLYRDGDAPAACDLLRGAISGYGRFDWLVAGERWMQRRVKTVAP